jgi:nicotinamidase-related amidase
MPIDLRPYLDPARCAIAVFECQEAVIGARAQIPGLARAVHDRDVLGSLARFLAAARAAGATVFYLNMPSPGERTRPVTGPMAVRMAQVLKEMGPPQGEEDWSVVTEVAPASGDRVALRREGGYSGFYESDFESQLVELGLHTVLPVGVSLNLGIIGTTIDAAQRGYDVVIPTDCVAGDPPEYGDQVLRYALRNIAFTASSQTISETWAEFGA